MLLSMLLGLGALLFLTQEINPFPHDWWFATHDTLVSPLESPRYNYTPVAAPAWLYAFNHVVVETAGFGLEQEMVAGVALHHLLLAVSAWTVYLTCRALGARFAVSACCALGFALYLQSTQMAQSFWSESVILPLHCLTVYGAVQMSAQPPGSAVESSVRGAVIGVLLGLAVITRAVPIVMAPAVVLLPYPNFNGPLWRWFSAAFLGSLAAVVLLQMNWNAHVFGRFELSHSTALHLWNAVSPDGDAMLADSELYQNLKSKVPNIQDAWWWDLPREEGQDDVVFEDLLRPMILDGIAKHPFVFLRRGLLDFVQILPRSVGSIGYLRADYYNPLERDSLLPAPGFHGERIARVLQRGNELARGIYRWAVPSTLAGGLLLVVARLWTSKQGLANPAARTWLLLGYSFVGAVFLSNLIERLDERYALPYLGALAVLFGLTAQMATDLALRLCEIGRDRLG